MVHVSLVGRKNLGGEIYRQLRRAILDGRLRVGDQLPPVRQLGLDLGVHFNTVAQAYRELSDEGWLELKRRRGAAVRPG